MAYVRNMRSSAFLRHNVIFFIGSMSVAVLNYLYHPILSHLMSLESFGEAQALFSIFTQASVGIGIFGFIALNIFANHDPSDVRAPMKNLYSFMMYAVGVMSLLLLVLSPALAHSMQFSSPLPFVLLPVMFMTSVPSAMYRYYLQSKHRFWTLSIGSAIAALGRLLFAALFVLAGAATFGAMIGLVIAIILSLTYVWNAARDEYTLPTLGRVIFDHQLLGELWYGLLILAGMGTITFFYTADVIIVKHFFSPEMAGAYSGVATVARIIIFATGSVAGVLFSYIKFSNGFAENARILYRTLALTGFIGGAITLILALFPGTIVSLLTGSNYLSLASELPLLALTMLFVAFANVFVSYFLALRESMILLVSALSLCGVFVGILTVHDTIRHIINILLAGSACLLLTLCILYVIRRHHVPRAQNSHDYRTRA